MTSAQKISLMALVKEHMPEVAHEVATLPTVEDADVRELLTAIRRGRGRGGESLIAASGIPQHSPGAVIRAVTQATGVSIKEIVGRSRLRRVSDARLIAIFLMERHCLSLSLVEIGRSIGGRSHSTVIHSISTAESLASTNADFRAKLEMAREELNKTTPKTKQP
jgi:hypothetical protein